ncbi:ATP-binding protein [Protaetiibacter larvae]|uniref:PspC domain-containing protein n=1 Tax=Protaetiibacter larvae TaxID=2592654 RepID=A0A5C1Y4T9_9MICO|nr:ATP-binding protein [Protaetiibacter larvae]QEO08771.1 PspC domain-containing protein [Protaetiibacter larvae]
MTAAVARPPLVRPREVLLGGVSAGVARHLGIPPAGARFAFLGLALVAGVGVLLYLWLWAFVPREDAGTDAPGGRVVPVGAVLLVASTAFAIIGVVTTWFAFYPVPPGILESTVLSVGAIAWTLFADRHDPRHARSAPVVRAFAATLLIVEGGLVFAGALSRGLPMPAVLGVLLVLIGVAVLFIPRLITLWSELGAERTARAREEQRAEIAAHLHDSVLQTLAIIQNRAGTGTEIARIARAQERELRDWLFAGSDPFADDLATELRTIARELELEHAVRIEVVTVGDVGEVASAALAGAAREALVNAARHAGGEVAVYAEATPESVEVFVRDRGAGFDPDAVPDGRLGIRESIVGRMARAGGSAVVTSGADGTEVQLRLPRRATSAPASGKGAEA